MYALFLKTSPTKPQPCHTWSLILCFATTLGCRSLVIVLIPRLLQCGKGCYKVVINLVNKIVTSLYNLAFSVWVVLFS